MVGSDGRVKDVELLNHLPYGLDYEAIKAVSKMRFRPATASGKPIQLRTDVKVEFRLSCRRK
jgi:TonB family protein